VNSRRASNPNALMGLDVVLAVWFMVTAPSSA
jgi:hypothetical protein